MIAEVQFILETRKKLNEGAEDDQQVYIYIYIYIYIYMIMFF